MGTRRQQTPSALPRLAEGVAEPELGFFGPDSAMWRIGRESAVLLGGPAAVLLQLAHPAVAAGVAQHSEFERDPIGRLRRTFDVVDRILFGSVEEAVRAAARVRSVHAAVRGRLVEDAGPHRAGAPYEASRPDLLLWVHATLVQQSMEGYDRFVRPLAEAERCRYYADTVRFGRLFGIPSRALPRTLDAFREYYAHEVSEVLAVADGGMRLRRVLFGGLPETWPLKPVSLLLAGGLLPPRVREMFEIPWSPGMQFAFERLARTSRRALPLLPDRVRFGRVYLQARRRLERRLAA